MEQSTSSIGVNFEVQTSPNKIVSGGPRPARARAASAELSPLGQHVGEKDEITVRYTLLQKVSIVAGTATFAITAVGCFYQGLQAAQKAPIITMIVALFGCWFLYLTWMGIGLLQSINKVIVAGDDGLNITSGEATRFYSWNELGDFRRNRAHKVFWVRDRSGQKIALLDDGMKGTKELRELLEQRASGAVGPN